MKPLEFIEKGSMVWVMDDNLSLKLISVDDLIWCDEPENEGWNIVCDNQEYWLELCFSLEHKICAN